MRKRSTTRGRRFGEFLRIDDRTGFQVWSGDTQKEWNGLIVSKRVWEARHPQDFVRGVPDDLHVIDSRPDIAIANVHAVGPLVTTAAKPQSVALYAPLGAIGQFALGAPEDGIETNATGDFGVSVASIAGMKVGDTVSIVLDNSNTLLTTITALYARFSAIGIEAGLPSSVSAGNLIVDYTASVKPVVVGQH